MAVQPSAGRSVPLFVLIIFIVLFLIATTGVVLLFVNQESVRQQAAQDKSLFDTYVGPGVSSKLDPYKALGSSSRPNKTAVAALVEERDELARLLTGNKTSMSKEAAERLDKTILSLPKDSAQEKKFREITKSDLIGALQQAILLVKSQMDETAAVQEQLGKTQKDLATVTAKVKELEDAFGGKTKEFLTLLADLQKRFDAEKQSFNEQLETVKGQVSKDLQDKLTAMGKTFNSHTDELREMVRRNLQMLIKATTEAGPTEFRAASLMTVDQLTQKTDGEVLDVTGPMYYISVGTKQGIKPGIRFDVISRHQEGQVNPAVKAVLEVTDVGEMTAEAKLIWSLPGDPVIQGDRLINMVFDRDLKLNFFVLGEFDFTGSGMIDPNGYQKVVDAVTRSGGKVSKQLSPTVNFVVMGLPPEKALPGQDAQKQSQQMRMYADLKDQIQALGVPVVTPELFVKYTGYGRLQ